MINQTVKYSIDVVRKVADITAWPPEMVAAKWLFDLGWRDDTFMTHDNRLKQHLSAAVRVNITNYLRDFERGATLYDREGRRRQYREIPCV